MNVECLNSKGYEAEDDHPRKGILTWFELASLYLSLSLGCYFKPKGEKIFEEKKTVTRLGLFF